MAVSRIEVRIRTFEGCFEVEMTFKNILEVPALIPDQFPYKNMFFHEIRPQSRKIDKKLYFYIKSLSSIPSGGPIGLWKYWKSV